MNESVRDFIKKLCVGDAKNVLDVVLERDTQDSTETLNKVFSELSECQLDEMWNKLFPLCQTHIEAITTENDEEVALASKVILAIAKLAKLSIKRNPLYMAEKLMNTVAFLNGWLLDLPIGLDSFKNEICKLCEEWLAMDLEGKDVIASHTVLYIMQRALGPNSQKVNLQRIWNIRHCITIALEEEMETTDRIMQSIMECFSSKLFLSNSQGRKFLTFLLTLDDKCMEKCHYAAKNFFMTCSVNEAEVYGNIYFNAWSQCKGILKEAFEEKCIQDMIYFAVHMPPSETKLFTSMRRVLNAFIAQKHQREVSLMLLKLYDPILWRCLKVANHLVRKNAAYLLFDAFPLDDPSTLKEQAQINFENQCQSMEALMEDSSQYVRAVAAYGICAVLERSWEMFQAEDIQRILGFVCNDLMYDSSSVEVRAAVLKGLRLLLGNHFSHSLLKVLLPKTCHAFHDVSEKVRVEYCNLLIKVKVIPDIQFWKIVPMEHLLARLEEDKPNVCQKIFNLISNSFFPPLGSNFDRVNRCYELIKMNPAASREFFHHLSKSGDVTKLSEYMVSVARTLHNQCKKELAKATESISDNESDDNESNTNKENFDSLNTSEEEEREGNLISSSKVVCGFLDSVCILWWGMNSRKEKVDKDHLKAITKEFTKVSPMLFKRFKNSIEVQQTLIYLCSCVKAPLPLLNSKSISLLKALPDTAPTERYVNILGSLCHQNLLKEILELINSWLSSILLDTSNTKTTQRRSKVVVVDPVTPKPLLAIRFLRNLLELKDARLILVNKHRETLENKILKQLRSAKELIHAYCIDPKSTTLNNGSAFLKEAFSLFCQLAVLLHQKEPVIDKDEKFDSIIVTIETIFWVQNELLPIWLEVVEESSEEPSSENVLRKDMLRSVFETLLKIMSDMFLISVANESFCSITEQFICTVLQLGFKDIDQVLVCDVLNNLVGYVMMIKASEENGSETPRMDAIISNLISKLFQTISKNTRLDAENAGKRVNLLKPYLARILSTLVVWLDPKEVLLHDVVATAMATSVAEITKLIDKYGVFDGCDDINDLPLVTSAVLSIIASKTNLMRIFLSGFEECLESGVIKEMPGCLAMVHIVRTLCFDSNHCKLHPTDLHKSVIGVKNLFDELKKSSRAREVDLNTSSARDKFSEMVTLALTEINNKLNLW